MIGIVYSEKTRQVFCLEESYYYKHIFKERKDIKEDIAIRYVPYCLNKIIAKEPDISKWSIDDIFKLK